MRAARSMPGRIRRLNPEPFLGMEAGAVPAIALATRGKPPHRLAARPMWFLGLMATAVFLGLLAIVAVNEEFTSLREQLLRERRGAALWTACRPPAPGERLSIYLEHSTYVGGLEYVCVYEPPRRPGRSVRLKTVRVVAP